jgi:hypothetical protein
MLSSFSFAKASSSVAIAGRSRTALRRNREPPAFLVDARRRRTARLVGCLGLARRRCSGAGKPKEFNANRRPAHAQGMRPKSVGNQGAGVTLRLDEVDRKLALLVSEPNRKITFKGRIPASIVGSARHAPCVSASETAGDVQPCGHRRRYSSRSRIESRAKAPTSASMLRLNTSRPRSDKSAA